MFSFFKKKEAHQLDGIFTIVPPKFLHTDFYTAHVCSFFHCHSWSQISDICEDIQYTFHILPLSRPDIPLPSVSHQPDIFSHRHHNRQVSTQHFIPHSVPSTHIRKNVLSGKKPTERKPLQKSNQCTKSYSGIKKRLTGRTPANLT